MTGVEYQPARSGAAPPGPPHKGEGEGGWFQMTVGLILSTQAENVRLDEKRNSARQSLLNLRRATSAAELVAGIQANWIFKEGCNADIAIS